MRAHIEARAGHAPRFLACRMFTVCTKLRIVPRQRRLDMVSLIHLTWSRNARDPNLRLLNPAIDITGRKVEFPDMHFISEIANFLIQGGIG